jgi:Uma2 family endonuclease
VETSQDDSRILQKGRTWEQFEYLQKDFKNTRGLRLFYDDGTLEMLTPGEAHELFKSIIGCVIETFLFHQGIEFKPTGSMAQGREGIISAEADESSEIGGGKLSSDINFTRGDGAKLERYQALGVNEIWIWKEGIWAVYHLLSGRYEKVSQSHILPLEKIDLHSLSECIILGATSRIQAA